MPVTPAPPLGPNETATMTARAGLGRAGLIRAGFCPLDTTDITGTASSGAYYRCRSDESIQQKTATSTPVLR